MPRASRVKGKSGKITPLKKAEPLKTPQVRTAPKRVASELVIITGMSGSGTGSAWAALGALPLLLDECERRGLRVGPLGEHGLR